MTKSEALIVLGRELRVAFQGGKDREMLSILHDKQLLPELQEALASAGERELTFAAPYIADLSIRLGNLMEKRGTERSS